ncbi:MAG: NeuD/PglB/VioB family sugar acetyltransferase [Bacteroidota bacterium]
MNKFIVVGTGGFAREILCLATDLGRYDDFHGFVEPDDIWEKRWRGKSIMGKAVYPQSSFDENKYTAIIGIGNPAIRKKVTSQLPANTKYENLIHPSVVISQWVTLEEGTVICAGCILTCNIKAGKHMQLNLHTTIGHDCIIGDFFTTAPSSNISGNCVLGDEVYFGTASATRQGISICDGVTIGMGAMVIKDIESPGVYVGIPAKKRN